MLFAVYGTLRNGGSNHRMIRQAEFMGVQTIPGFEMYSLGAYPYIIEGGGTIAVEVYDVTELSEIRAIMNMEQGAGYSITAVDTVFGLALLFLMPYWEHSHRPSAVEIPNGDWILHRTIEQIPPSLN